MGVLSTYEISPSFHLLCDLSMRFMFSGEILIDFAERDASVSSPTAQLGSEIGFRAYVPAEIYLTPSILFTFGPWYEYSSIGKSNEVYVMQNGAAIAQMHEPASRTHQFGANIGMKLEF